MSGAHGAAGADVTKGMVLYGGRCQRVSFLCGSWCSPDSIRHQAKKRRKDKSKQVEKK